MSKLSAVNEQKASRHTNNLILTFFSNLNVLVLKQVCIFVGKTEENWHQIMAATLLLELILSP